LRTCVGCRNEDSRAVLLRYVLREQQLLPDPEKKLPGRGAWLHDSPECRRLALAKHGFDRSFRINVDATLL
jgi:predicted RNA-binding protein YlxR (DUF448 family)